MSAWCILVSMATRSFSTPSMNHSSHRGRARSSLYDINRPMRSSSSLRPPGGDMQCVVNVPVPRLPLMLDFHAIFAFGKGVSSASVTFTEKVIDRPENWVDPSVGSWIATVGLASTTMLTLFELAMPLLSVAVTVILCVPRESALAKVRPVPIFPPRLDVH